MSTSMAGRVPVGRLAPSPTGAQHVGNARTFLLAWLSARSQGGRLLLRVEDIDSPRVKLGADQQAIDDLCWLGLDWDEGPDVGGPHAPYHQTQRVELYRAALLTLQQQERVYPCTCSRTDVLEAASAPHIGQEGPVYPGTCAIRRVAEHAQLERTFCWRFRASYERHVIQDRVAGPQACCPGTELGDFVIGRVAGDPAYQLAVVVDDQAMGVTEVVRGDDLLPSTFRQLEVMQCFGWSPPQYAHVPLVVGPDGRRLAKRHGDTRLATLRAQRVPAEKLLGLLAWSCGWCEFPVPTTAEALLPGFTWDSLPRTPWIWHDGYAQWLLGQIAWEDAVQWTTRKA